MNFTFLRKLIYYLTVVFKGKNMTYDFRPNEIFKASDVMVDALTKLLDNERNKRKIN